MTDYQREVLDHFVECGLKLTMKKFAIKQRRLLNWRKKFNEHYEGKLFKEKHDGEMLEVVDYANTHGLRKATLKYGVTIKTIWDWKAKVQLLKKGSKRMPRPRRSVDEDTKGEIIQTYLEEGAFATEKKYNIPRQTVRYWALQRGTVQVKRGLASAWQRINFLMKIHNTRQKDSCAKIYINTIFKSEDILELLTMTMHSRRRARGSSWAGGRPGCVA